MTTTLTMGWIYASLWLEDALERAAGEHDGAETTEYALVAAGIGLAALIGIKVLGPTLATKFQTIAGSVSGA